MSKNVIENIEQFNPTFLRSEATSQDMSSLMMIKVERNGFSEHGILDK
jgi:hypothetical protein